MTRVAQLQCRCGGVHSHLTNASRRILCYRDDCQAFLQHLGRSDLGDARGGTDVVQLAPASLSFDRGGDHIVGLRPTPRGLYGWYASCSKSIGRRFIGPIATSVVHPDSSAGRR